MLLLNDFNVLYVPFAQEVQRLFPVPVDVCFCDCTSRGVLTALSPAPAVCGAGDVDISNWTSGRLVHDQLILPLRISPSEQVAVVLSGVDPPLLRKMSPEWLKELLVSIVDQFEKIRPIYIDPETGLYNSRAAEVFQQRSVHQPFRFFLLLSILSHRVTAARTIQKNKEISGLLLALTEGVCFSYGHGVFGILDKSETREGVLKFLHYLQHRLKREGMRQVQAGFSALTPASGATQSSSKDNFWQALAIAEKRGPFGICELNTAGAHNTEPFIFAQPSVVKNLQKKWSGLAQFSLALITHENRGEHTVDWFKCVSDSVQEQAICIELFENGCAVLLPTADQIALKLSSDAIVDSCKQGFTAGNLSMGIASWPCLNFTKKDIPGNALKALLHASLLGPGSVVSFDHLSLNVSGDCYFEEGDYRSAIREYRRGLKLAPGDVNLINSLGVSLVECNQLGRAATCFQETLEKEPLNYMTLVNLGYVRQTLGDQTGALACFEQAYQVLSEDDCTGQELLLALARLYTELGRPAEALSVLERWQRVAGSAKEFLFFRLLGQNFLESGQPAKAMVACQKALQLFPQDSVSMSLLGLLYVQQGEGDQLGLSLCQKALDLDLFNADHWLRFGRALFHKGDTAEALAAVRHCLQLQRNHPEGILYLGQLYQSSGQTRRAEHCFRRLLSLKRCSSRQAKKAQQCLSDLVG